ncbi:recombinase family protein [bacterium]|nr:recombinase family protein [bacterium]
MYNDCVIYSRVSSDEQRQEGYSLDYQLKQLKTYCSENNLHIVQHFWESYTAKKTGRPEFNKMIEFVKKKKIKNLVFLKNDRASRNPVDSALLSYMAEHESYNIHLIENRLVLCSQSKPQDFLIFEIENGFANLYSRNLSNEVSSKMREKAEQGYYPSHAMAGYKTQRINKRSYLVIDEQKAPFIKMCFDLYATGQYSFRSLAAEMRNRGFIVAKKTKLNRSTIEKIIKNPVYMGEFNWNGKRYKGKHEPIISKELFYICQKIVNDNNNNNKKTNTKKQFLFSGLIKCSHCGCQLVGEIKKNKYIYYHCTGNRGGDCKRKYLKETMAENLFIDVLERLKINESNLNIIENLIKSKISENNFARIEQAKTLQSQINKTNERLEKMFEMYLDGLIDSKKYKQKHAEFVNQLDDLNIQLKINNSSEVDILEFSQKILELVKTAPILYERGTVDDKKELINLLCSNFLWDGEKLTITIKKAFEPLVQIAKILNGGR